VAEIPNIIKSTLLRFVDELKRNHIDIRQAFFVWQLRPGTFDSWSDIDIALVSDGFRGSRFQGRNMVWKIKLSVSSNLEHLPLIGPKTSIPQTSLLKKSLRQEFEYFSRCNWVSTSKSRAPRIIMRNLFQQSSAYS